MRILDTDSVKTGYYNCVDVVQGGIYTLPSHLSPGARDLIPQLLLVDPVKRMTIPEIRQHPWFKLHLPRYLAVPAPDVTQHLKKVIHCNLFIFQIALEVLLFL